MANVSKAPGNLVVKTGKKALTTKSGEIGNIVPKIRPPFPPGDLRPGWTTFSTSFDINRHGFRFVNDFAVQPLDFPLNNLRFHGLCGGMVYAALDYFNTGMIIPNQNYRPATGTVLQRFISHRQGNSIWDNKDKWLEVIFNPGGIRNDEFFNWGLQRTNGGRVDELRQTLGNGKPTPLGLINTRTEAFNTSHHQVLAVGYSIGPRPEDLEIRVYDPNIPGQLRTLVPDLTNRRFHYKESPDTRWQTYFVDKNHHTTSPPAIPQQSTLSDGFVRELMLEISTGGDDLRGGNDNVHATVLFRSGEQQVFHNINLLQRWIDDYTETVPLVLNRATKKEDIVGVILSTTFTGGIGGDNWNIDKFKVWYLNQGNVIYSRAGTPLVRLTGDNKVYSARFWTNELSVILRTGGDDLRGGNDAFITLHYEDESNSNEYRLNQGRSLNNNSTQTIAIDVPLTVTADRIKGVTIRHDGQGHNPFQGYDNWNLDGLQIAVNGIQVLQVNGAPLIRFTGDKRSHRWDR
ncbi:MAG: hypothetical protein KF870_09520 [Leadbetterella sp.]|nr:hypothetical protein [Leadbetterella sp.]